MIALPRFALVALALVAPALFATPLSAQSLKDRVVAEAAAAPSPPFERTVTVTQSDGKASESEARVDRWDGRAWTLLSVGGKPPSAKALASYAKSQMPVPSYARLAPLLARAAPAGADAQGRALLRAGPLPTGSVTLGSRDISDKCDAEATVEGGAKPWVRQLRVTARAPFRMMLVAKVDRFTRVIDYRPDAAGRPRVARIVTEMTGAMMGEAGTQRIESVFSYK